MDSSTSESGSIPFDLSAQNLDLSEDEFESLVETWLMFGITDEEDARQTTAVIETLARANRPELIGIFCETVEEKYGDQPEYPYISRLFTNIFSHNAILILSQVVPVEFFDVIRGLIQINDDKLITAAIANLEVLFPTPEDIDPEAVSSLLPIAQEANNRLLIDYLGGISSVQNQEVAEVPPWIIQPEVLQTLAQLERDLPPESRPQEVIWKRQSIEGDIEMFAKLAAEADPNIDIDLLRKDLWIGWTQTPQSEAEETLTYLINNQALSKLEYDRDLFLVYGACLPIPNGNTLAFISDDVCQLHGGCRVLTCYHNERIDDTFDPNPDFFDDPSVEDFANMDWFTGKCASCGKTIRKRCYALRRPLVSGGWSGENYCNFACMRNTADPNDLTQQTLIDRIETAYREYKVVDRDES